MENNNQTTPVLNRSSAIDDEDDDYAEAQGAQPDLSAVMGSINTYMTLIKPYSGDTTRDQSTAIFFDTLEEMAKMASWPDSILHFVLLNKLSGKAAAYYETNLKSLRGRSLIEIRYRFSRRFDTQVTEDPWKAIQTCRQAIGEPVEDYAHRLMDLQDRCNNDGSDSYIGRDRVLSLFMEGITPTLKEHMITIYPDSLGQAVKIASRIEKRISSINKRGSAMMAEAVNSTDAEDNGVTYAMSTLAIRKETDSADGQQKRLTYNEPAETSTAVRKTYMPQNNSTYVGNREKERKKYHEVKQPGSRKTNTPKSTFRDTSRTSIGALNKQYGGTKHIVLIHVGKNIVKGLVDPASDYSIISEDTVKSLGLISKIYKGEVSSIAGALGGLIDSESCLDLIFKLDTNGDKYKHSFRLATGRQILNYAAILGMDYLQPNLAQIDYHQNTLSLWGNFVANLIPVNKVQSSSNLLEFMIKGDKQNSENAATEEVQYILVHFQPDGTWIPIENIEIAPEEDNSLDEYKVVGQTDIRAGISDTFDPTVTENYIKRISDNTHATGADLERLLLLCRDYKAIMEPEDAKLRILHNFTHTVELSDYTPIKKPQYQIPVALRSKLKDKLDEYLDSDIIEPSCSPWNLPLIVKQKKTGELRLILDATAVNNVTKKIDYPIVRIEDTFHHLMNRKWFTSIDLKNGYHQIQLSTQSRQFYAFKTPYGKHHFKRMPMGASNSGLFFQKVMEKILAPLDPTKIVIYQDDILLATDTVDEHLALLKEIFIIFARENVQVNGEKSSFMRHEMEFLGHVLKQGSFAPSPENLAAINTLQPPKTKKQLRGILGKINFYARFVPSLSLIALPLTNLLAKKKKEIVWGTEEEEAFTKLKALVCEAPILRYPNFSRKFIVTIRVSGSALFSALEQDHEDGRWPLAYFSKKLTKPQQNYSIIERHALAVITTLEYFHHIIHGYEVEVVTDRKAVEYLRGLKDGSTRTMNWINLAAKYSPSYIFNQDNLAISHILDIGKDNQTVPLQQKALGSDKSKEGLAVLNSIGSQGESLNETSSQEDTGPIEEDGDIKADDTGTITHSPAIQHAHGDAAESHNNYPTAYTDGSCNRNGKPSAVAGMGIHWENNHFPEYYGPCDTAHSNNKAELQAIIKAITLAIDAQAPGIMVCSDSSYAIINITQNLQKWKGNNWLSLRGKTIENIEYFKRIDELSKRIPIIWKHIRGHSGHKGNERAHTLALMGCAEAEQQTPLVCNQLPTANTETQSLAIRATTIPVAMIITDSYIAEQQLKDPECIRISDQNITEVMPKKWENGVKCYKDSNGVLRAKGVIEISPRIYKKVDGIYAPDSCRKKVLDFIHLSKWTSHNNYNTLCNTILDKYFWSTFRTDIRKYISECSECQKMNSTTKRPIVGDFPKPRHPGEKLAIDIVGPIITATGGEKYILTMIDMCSRYLTLAALREISTIEVVKAIERNYIATFGTPSAILTDRGSNFRSKVFEDACKLMHVKHLSTAPYRPSTNGMIERANREIKRKLTLLCNHAGDTWAEKLYLVGFAHNNAWHTSIATSPNKLVFGHRMRFPGWEVTSEMEIQNDDTVEFIEELKSRLNFVRTLAYEHEAKERHKRNDRINKKRYVPTFKSGDLVMMRTVNQGKSRKHGFYFQYSGPYRISKTVSEVTYDIRSTDSTDTSADIRVHAERLKPFVLSSDKVATYTESQNQHPMCTDGVEDNIQSSTTVVDHTEIPSKQDSETTDKGETTNTLDSCPAIPQEEKPETSRYYTRSKGKVDEEALKKVEIIRGKVVARDRQR